MGKKIWREVRNNIKEGFCEVWKALGTWVKLVEVIVSGFISYFTAPISSPLILFVRTILIALIIYVIISLFYSLFIHPYKTIRDQKSTIALLKERVSNKSIIEAINIQRTIGVNLWNEGKVLFHESSIETWWNKHLAWRKNTKELIALINKGSSIHWNTLAMFQKKGKFPKALNQKHRKKLQMFGEWLVRLEALIKGLGSKD